MDKILISALLAVMALALYYHAEAERARELGAVYQGNNQVLINKIRKVYDDKVALDKRNAELEQAAAEDKAFDWHYNIAHSPVIKRLQAD